MKDNNLNHHQLYSHIIINFAAIYRQLILRIISDSTYGVHFDF